ncbi:RAP protein, putative [Babesia caballi]|uniref:RAP protein, putative n=1 Tax=Babesia caballi TaxID=5871 RepID=A0AAV4LZH1_BABCB|nr:RAP protein, putative [Babesia caballi]
MFKRTPRPRRFGLESLCARSVAARSLSSRGLTTASSHGAPPNEDDEFIPLPNTGDVSRRTRSHTLVDISDENEDVSARVLTQKEFLAAKNTRFVTKEEYEKLKPHEVRKHVAATMKPVDLEAKYGKKRAKKIIQRRELQEHGKVTWNPRDRVGEADIKEFSSDDIDLDRRPRVERFHFLNKSVYDMTEDEFYSSFFRDRERRFDGMGNKLSTLEAQILKEQRDALSATPRTRIAPKAYWLKPDYISPTVDEVGTLNSMDLRFVMMNEARKAVATCEIDTDLWNAFLTRANAMASKVCLRTLLRFLQIVSKVQLTPSAPVKALVDHVHRRSAEMKPKHYVFLFQALGRLRLRDQRLYDDMYEMVLCWPVLRNNFLVKAANALAKLSVCDSLLLQPLRQVLAKRLESFSATDCVRVKAITVIELFDDDMVISFLQKCEYHRQHFRHYSRNLELIELYLRLLKTDVYDRLDDATKQFLIDARQQTLSKKLAESDLPDTTEDVNDSVWLSSDNESSDSCYSGSGQSYEDTTRDTNQAGSAFTTSPPQPFHCAYHEDVSRVMTLMGVAHRNFMVAGPFSLDIFEPKSNTVIEINTEHQYYHGTTHLTAMARRRHEMIAGMGFRLLHIPYRWWRQLEGDQAKESAMRTLLRFSD